MAYILLVTAFLVFVLARGAGAEETTATAKAATPVAEEQSDFELLTPISQAEVEQIRGEGVLAPYSVILASAFAVAQSFRSFYLQGCVGTITRNADGTYALSLPPACITG